jgi:predicted transposase YdaD
VGSCSYLSRSTEQTNGYPYRALLDINQVHRVYLDELGEIAQLPLGVALMVLNTVDEDEAPAAARMLLDRTERESYTQGVARGIYRSYRYDYGL